MATVAAAVLAVNTGNNAALTTGTFTTAAGDLLVAIAVVTGQAGGGTFSDNGGLGWTNVITALKASSADTLVVAVANNFDVAQTTTRTVTFTPAGSPTSSGVGISVLTVSGMSRKGINAIRSVSSVLQAAVQSNQAAAGTPAPALPAAALTGNPTIGAVANASNPAAMTTPTNWSEAHDNGYATPTTGIETVFRNSGFTGTTVTWGGTSATAFASAIIELDTSAQIALEDEIMPSPSTILPPTWADVQQPVVWS